MALDFTWNVTDSSHRISKMISPWLEVSFRGMTNEKVGLSQSACGSFPSKDVLNAFFHFEKLYYKPRYTHKGPSKAKDTTVINITNNPWLLQSSTVQYITTSLVEKECAPVETTAGQESGDILVLVCLPVIDLQPPATPRTLMTAFVK